MAEIRPASTVPSVERTLTFWRKIAALFVRRQSNALAECVAKRFMPKNWTPPRSAAIATTERTRTIDSKFRQSGSPRKGTSPTAPEKIRQVSLAVRESAKLKALIRMEFGPFGAAKTIFPVEVHRERETAGLAGGTRRT